MPDFEPIDEYKHDEIDYLRQELEEMEIKLDKWKELAEIADSEIRKAHDIARKVKLEYQKASIDVNAEITAKCSLYLQVIEEYQKIIGANMVTNTLVQLRKKGELEI